MAQLNKYGRGKSIRSIMIIERVENNKVSWEIRSVGTIRPSKVNKAS